MNFDNRKYLKLIKKCNKLLDKEDKIEDILNDLNNIKNKQQFKLIPFYIQQEQKPNEIIYKLDSQNKELIDILELLTNKFKDSITKLPSLSDIEYTQTQLDNLNKMLK